MTFAIIETGGKQHKVASEDTLRVEKLDIQVGEPVVFDRVLLKVNGDSVTVGQPYIKDARVEGVVTDQGKEAKKIVFRYHSKTRYRKKKGHRQPYTEVKIKEIR